MPRKRSSAIKPKEKEELSSSQAIVKQNFTDDDEAAAIKHAAEVAKGAGKPGETLMALDWLHKHKHASAFKTNAHRGTTAVVVRVVSHGQSLPDVENMEGVEVMTVNQ